MEQLNYNELFKRVRSRIVINMISFVIHLVAILSKRHLRLRNKIKRFNPLQVSSVREERK